MLHDWSRISPDTIFGSLLRLPLKTIPKRMTVKVQSGINRGMKWIVGSSTHGCWLGTYELEKQSVIRRYVTPGMTVFDIGANAGFYTLAFSRLVGKEGRVCAFEPLAENANNILRHMNLNELQNVTLLQTAISDRNGVVGFNVAKNNAMGFIDQAQGLYKVPTVSLDDLIADGVVPAPDVIKMDVEGAESLVLRGAKEVLTKKKAIFFIALHGDDQKRQCIEILRSSGYESFHLDGQSVTDVELAGDDIYATPG
jgi:FkbM family methyltransferase